MKHIANVDDHQIVYIIGVDVIAANCELGIEWNVEESDLLWICGVAIVNDVNALVLIVLKNVISPGVYFSRLLCCSRIGDGNSIHFSRLHINGHPGL